MQINGFYYSINCESSIEAIVSIIGSNQATREKFHSKFGLQCVQTSRGAMFTSIFM